MGTMLTRDPAQVHENPLRAKRGDIPPSNGNGLSGHLAGGDAKTGGTRRQFETPNSDSPGFLLLDSLLRPLYINDEAVSILAYPQILNGNGQVASFLKQEIASLLPRSNGSAAPRFPSEFESGRRQYKVRVFTLKSNLQNHSGATLAVLLERNREHPALSRAARTFHLTQREIEALNLLMQGYTTKQIACRMDISPNTAKAFLRSVMFKSGASNRAGILAKILQL